MAVNLREGWRGPYLQKKKKAPSGFRYVQPGPKWQQQFPDKKPRWVLAPAKASSPAPTGDPQPNKAGNVILWVGKNRPNMKTIQGKFGKDVKVNQAGDGRWVVVRKKPGEGGGGGPETPPDPYADYPFFQRTLESLNKAEQQHIDYATGKVQPWLSESLKGLTGVDPNQPGYNATLQQQYQANVAGPVGGALKAAATATPMTPASAAPGGIMASPTGFESAAAREAAAARQSSALQAAEAQGALNTIQPNTLAQGAVQALADYTKGLPALYAQKRMEFRNKADQFIMEYEEDKRRWQAQFDEQKRQFGVTSGIDAMTAQGNLALAFGQLGLSEKELMAELNAPGPPGMPDKLPEGFVAVPNDEGGWDIRQKPKKGSGSGGSGVTKARWKQKPSGFPTVHQDGWWYRPEDVPGTSTRSPTGGLRPNVLRERGWAGNYKRKPRVNQKRFQLTQASDGTWWVKKKKGSGGKKPDRENPGDLATELSKKYNGSGGGPFGGGSKGWKQVMTPDQAVNAAVQFIKNNRASFRKPNGKIDRSAVHSVVFGAIKDRYAAHVWRRLNARNII